MEKNNYFELTGEIAIVTGGLGQLGSQFTAALTGAGAKVAIVDIKNEITPHIKSLIDDGREIKIYKADITNKAEVAGVYASIVGDLGVPTILINNAGIDNPPNSAPELTGPFETYPETAWDAVIDSHIKGAFLMSQEFFKNLTPTKRPGSIINISSTYGVVTPDQSIYEWRRKKGEVFYKPVAYSVAKSGMLNFTRWLAEYGGPHGIRANTLVPGGVFNNQAPEFLAEYNKRTILGRMAGETDYNAAIIFLASTKASSYMTGSILTIDGGWTAR